LSDRVACNTIRRRDRIGSTCEQPLYLLKVTAEVIDLVESAFQLSCTELQLSTIEATEHPRAESFLVHAPIPRLDSRPVPDDLEPLE
jgi:hypothetical protein